MQHVTARGSFRQSILNEGRVIVIVSQIQAVPIAQIRNIFQF